MRNTWFSAIGLLALIGCGGEAARTPVHSGVERALATSSAKSEEIPSDSPSPNEDSTSKRKIVYVAQLELVVQEFSQAESELPGLVTQYDGYLADVSIDRTQGESRSGHWSVRVPIDKFEAFVNAVSNLGVAERLSQQAQDVTEEFIDLEARIVNKKRLEERLLELVESPNGEIKDVIEVERELARVREEIERMEGRLRYLANRTALATVTIKVREERGYVPPQAPSFLARTASAWNVSLDAMRQLGEAAAITAVAASPWLLALAVASTPPAWYIRRRQHARNATAVNVQPPSS